MPCGRWPCSLASRRGHHGVRLICSSRRLPSSRRHRSRRCPRRTGASNSTAGLAPPVMVAMLTPSSRQ
eukprot:14263592-Alexandrium_andersonii.AAC.1